MSVFSVIIGLQETPKLYLSILHITKCENGYHYNPWYPPEHSSEGHFDKESSSVAVYVLQVLPLLTAAFTFKIIYSTPFTQSIGYFYCLVTV